LDYLSTVTLRSSSAENQTGENTNYESIAALSTTHTTKHFKQGSKLNDTDDEFMTKSCCPNANLHEVLHVLNVLDLSESV